MRQALLPVLVLGMCVAVSWPFAETGMHDDGYYILMARTFARTGQIDYNGWGAPMLGFQLLPAALLIKWVGFSFSIARLPTILAALLLTGLLQRAFVRCGVSGWNASLATMTVLTSPVALPLVTSFLSDIWCLLAIVVCFYCCLRTLEASSSSKAAVWICVAAAGNDILGSSRQIAWLGVLVMVPCTIAILRGQPRVLRAGAGAVLVSVSFILASLRWLAGKPYTLPERFEIHGVRHILRHPSILARPALEVPMLLLPVLLMFLPMVWRSRGRGRAGALCALAILCVCGWHEHRLHLLSHWYVPFIVEPGSVFGPKGVYRDWPVWGTRPALLPAWMRAALALATLAGVVGWVAQMLTRTRAHPLPMVTRTLKRREVAYLTLPFAAAYVLFLLPRALRDLTIDRYLVPLVMVVVLWLVLLYQERVGPELPRASLVFALLIAGYSAATLQDAFALYRAVVMAGDEVMHAGIPRAAFDGGDEYDGITQVTLGGYMHQSGIRMPAGTQLLFGHRRTGPCEISFDVWIPDVNPAYALAYTPDGCGGPTSFRPITYRRLLWPHKITLYLVQDPDLSGKQGLFTSFE